VDELIKTVSEKAGINPEQAKTAVNSVVEFIKGKLPMVGEQVQGMLSGSGDGSNPLAGAADALKKKFGF
jgi:nucleoid DNA-binding protein